MHLIHLELFYFQNMYLAVDKHSSLKYINILLKKTNIIFQCYAGQEDNCFKRRLRWLIF